MSKNYLADVLSIAKKEIGTKETGNNDNKYGKELGNNNVAWCYLFISWVMKKAGLNIPSCAYVPTGYRWYKAKGRIFKTPQVGDLAFFCWNKEYFAADKSIGIPQHISFVLKVNNDGTFETIEGNTSDHRNKKLSADNGDGVYSNTRRLTDVKGFGRPNYIQ